MNLRDLAKSAYDKSGLPYHSWRHVEACLAEFEAVRTLCEKARLVEVAIWYHDVGYDPTQRDNEINAARIAAAAMCAGDEFSMEDVEIVEQLILDTRHTAEPA